MKEVWILTCDWNCYGDTGHDIIVVAKSKETCIAQMHTEIQLDCGENGCLENYLKFDENDSEHPYKLINPNPQDSLDVEELYFECNIDYGDVYVQYSIDRYFVS